jgi:type III secretion system YscD/HrpQ family protein
MGNHYILKVFSGPHIGAEILLSRGRMLIGRGDQCDIVLYDSAISLEHVELVISDQEIQISSIDQTIFIAGKALTEKTVKVDTYQFITIGTTHFSIGINGEDWPQIVIPELDVLSTETTESVETGTSLDSKPDSPFHSISFPDFKRSVAKYLVRSKYTKLSVALSLVLTTSAAIAVSLALDGDLTQQASYASINGVFQKYDTDTPKKKVEIASETITKLKRKITQAKFSDIDVEQENNKFLVQGNVTSKTQKKQLIKLLEPYSHKIQLRVYIKQQQLSSAKNIASELRINKLNFSIIEPNILIVKGYIENENDWLQAKDILKDDIEGISEIDDEDVETQNHRILELEKLLEEQELISLVDIKSTPGQVLVMAELTQENAQHWETIAYTFKQRYGKHPILKAKIILLEMDPNDLDIQIRGIVTTGNESNIVLTTSGSYKEGEQFSNGFTIKTIEPRRVVLSRNHQTIELPIMNSALAKNDIDTDESRDDE